MPRFFRRAGAISFAFALLAVPAFAQDEHRPDDKQFVKWSDIMGKGSTFQLYGFIRTDAQWNDSRFNDPQIPGFVRSEDPTAPSSIGAPKNEEEFALHARLTRLGLDFTGPVIPRLGDARLTGNIEIDFYNSGLSGSDSRSAIRMRKAYVQLGWDELTVLAGQTWDLISPLFPAVNADLVMWGAGNLGDRRPQIRGTFAPEAFADLPATGLASNEVFYVTAKTRFDALRAGVEYLHWTTEYVGFGDGEANRFVFWVAYYF